jgi:hypothetical protein
MADFIGVTARQILQVSTLFRCCGHVSQSTVEAAGFVNGKEAIYKWPSNRRL